MRSPGPEALFVLITLEIVTLTSLEVVTRHVLAFDSPLDEVTAFRVALDRDRQHEDRGLQSDCDYKTSTVHVQACVCFAFVSLFYL